MTFDAAETSIAGGRPILLYEFRRGTLVWRYTSANREIVHQSNRFLALRGGISNDGIRQTGQPSADELRVIAPADIEVAQLYRGAPPSVEVSLTIFARHAGIDDYLVIWSGDIRGVRWPRPDRCHILCAQIDASIDAEGLRLAWQRSCPHALGSPACGVSLVLHRVSVSVQDMDGAAISNGSLAAYPDGHFTAGYVEWSIGGGESDARGIEQHSGSTLYLLGGTAGITPGSTVTVYPGCNQTTARCKYFDNLPNYGGIPHLAGESPFDGRNVF